MKKTKASAYPWWSNALWSFQTMLSLSPGAFWLLIALVPLSVFLAWGEIQLPALVIKQVTQENTLSQAIGAVGVLLGFIALATTAKGYLTSRLPSISMAYSLRCHSLLQKKSMSCFYETFEKKKVRDLLYRAEQAVWMWYGRRAVTDVPEKALALLENLFCYLLFGSVLSILSPWLVVLLTLTPMVNYFCQRAYQRYELKTRPPRTDLENKLEYVCRRSSDFAAAKDIRIYGMAQWLKRVYQTLLHQHLNWRSKLAGRQMVADLADLIVILLRDGIAYAVLIAMSLRGELTVDEFVLYFAAISNFATFVGNMISAWAELQEASLKLCDFRAFLDIPDACAPGEVDITPLLHSPLEITFDHVSFRYEKAEHDTLHDLSFTLSPGQRVALVGMNGAGKTTLVKLLCGLYRPTAGDIRINGISITKFGRDDYYRLFSPVFQDVQTAFFTLAQTVSCSFTNIDRKRVENCIRRVGLGEKLDDLPLGIDTGMDKQVHPDGTELSGGEAQKLIMARALYKDAPILVLDEPTAALDPIAENEIYLQYRDMTQGKTSLFISHRLASTRFCDTILFLKDGSITESGTHEELLAQGGEYARLYEIQSCWYRKDYKGGEEE